MLPFTLLAALAMPATAMAQSDPVGSYRLNEGHEAAGQLQLTADGHFQYFLAYGALDESARGNWRLIGGRACLFTEPKPVPPVFSQVPPIAVEGEIPTLLVTWPNGRGIAGVDFLLGFDRGDPIDGYTQEYGWTLPEDEARTPAWVEFAEPIHRVGSPRIAFAAADHGKLRVVLTPNDMGIVDFAGACLEQTSDQVVLHRREGPMRFKRVDD